MSVYDRMLEEIRLVYKVKDLSAAAQIVANGMDGVAPGRTFNEAIRIHWLEIKRFQHGYYYAFDADPINTEWNATEREDYVKQRKETKRISDMENPLRRK